MATLARSFSPAWEAVELTPWCGGRHDGAEDAISTKQTTCSYRALNAAFVCVAQVALLQQAVLRTNESRPLQEVLQSCRSSKKSCRGSNVEPPQTLS